MENAALGVKSPKKLFYGAAPAEIVILNEAKDLKAAGFFDPWLQNDNFFSRHS